MSRKSKALESSKKQGEALDPNYETRLGRAYMQGFRNTSPMLLAQIFSGENPIPEDDLTSTISEDGLADYLGVNAARTAGFFTDPAMLVGWGAGKVLTSGALKGTSALALRGSANALARNKGLAGLARAFSMAPKSLVKASVPMALEAGTMGAVEEGIRNPLKQYAEKGEVDPSETLKQMATIGGLGAVLGPAGELGGGALLRNILGPKTATNVASKTDDIASKADDIAPEPRKPKTLTEATEYHANTPDEDPLFGPPESLNLSQKPAVKTLKEAEAITETHARISGQDPKYHEQIKKTFVNEARNIEAQRGGTRHHADVMKDAEKVGFSFDNEGNLVIQGQKDLDLDTLNTFYQTVRASYMESIAEVSERFQKALPGSKEAAKASQELDSLMAKHAVIENKYQAFTTDLGRGLHASRFNAAPTDVFAEGIAKTMAALPDAEKNAFAKQVTVLKAQAQSALRANPDDVYGAMKPLYDYVYKFHKASVGEKAFELSLLNLLMGQDTWTRNILGNSAFYGWRTAQKIPAAAVDYVSSVGGLRRQREVFFGEAPAELFGTVLNLRKALFKAVPALYDDLYGQLYKTGASDVLGGKGKINFPAVKNPVGSIQRLATTRSLSAQDIFFRELTNGAMANSEVYKLAIKQGINPLTQPKKFSKFFRETINNLPDDILKKIREEADTRVFQKELPPFAKEVSAVIDRHTIPKLLMPFFRTPYNIIRESVATTPLAPISSRFRQDLAAGGERQAMALGGVIAGSSITGLFVERIFNSQEEWISGDYPRSRSEKSRWDKEGILPYSIKIDGEWQSYKDIEPFSTFLANAVNYVNAYKNREEGVANKYADKALMAAVDMSWDNMKAMSNQSSAASIAQIMKIIDADEKTRGKKLQQFLERRVRGSALPSSIAQTARAMDSTERQVENLGDIFKSGIPGLRETLPPKLDVFGKPIEKSEGILPFTNAYPHRKASTDPTIKELSRVHKESALKFPSNAEMVRGLKIPQEIRNEISKNRGGPLKTTLDTFIQNEGIESMPKDLLNDYLRSKYVLGPRVGEMTKAVRESTDVDSRVLNHYLSRAENPDKMLKKFLNDGNITLEEYKVLKDQYTNDRKRSPKKGP